MGSDNNKKIVIGALALGAVAGGAYLLLSGSKKAEEEEAADFAAPAPAAQDKKEAKTTENAPGEMTMTYSFNANEENERMLEEAYNESVKEEAKAAKVVKADKTTGVAGEFKNLGVTVGQAPGWVINEEMSPMPNVAMITFTKPEFQSSMAEQQMPGTTPVVILSVEDITAESLDLSEFKEKSKNMALTQMMMMTGGMFQPQVTFDDRMTVGQFGHCLEYESRTPYFTMQVMNLLQVKNGLAYVFQLMANPEVMSEYKPQVMQIAKSIELNVEAAVVDFEKNSCIRVATDAIEFQAPSTWMEKDHPADKALVTFTTSSLSKMEEISIFKTADAPHTESAKARKVATNDTYTVIATPAKAGTPLVVEDSTLAAVLASIKAGSSAAKPVFRTAKYGYEFEIVKGGKIIESRLGDGTVVYAPQGIPNPQDPSSAADGPIVTIRVGDKKTDPDCEDNLDEWFKKLQADADSAPITELRKTTMNGTECITFLNKEMQETGAGQKEERTGRVYIFVVNAKTTLIRWETSTGNFRKFERKLTEMMESFKLL